MRTNCFRLLCFGIAYLACSAFLGTRLLGQDYPLAKGTSWTYHLRKEVGPGVHFAGDDARVAKGNVVDTTLVAHVAGTDEIGGKTYTRVESYREGKLANVDWFALTSDGLIHPKTKDYVAGGESELNPPERLLSPGLAPQETWTWQDSRALVLRKPQCLVRSRSRFPREATGPSQCKRKPPFPPKESQFI